MKTRRRNAPILPETDADTMKEIEDGKIRPNCRACGQKQVIHVRLQGFETPEAKEILTGGRTHNIIGICINTSCYRYADTKNVPTWVPRASAVGLL